MALLAAAPALAQEETDEDGENVVRLGTIFLNGSGSLDNDAQSVVATELWVGGKVATSILDTPASVSVITEKEIKARNAETVEEVLQYSAGVHTDYYGTDDRNDYYMIRGFQATTYRDGLTLGSMRGVREEPLAYERVEVLRGANSALFGMADPGGSVNFVTRTPKFERIAETGLSVGSFDRRELTFDYNNVVASAPNLAFRVTGKVKEGGLDYDTSKDDETFLMAGLKWAPTDFTSLSVVADYLKRSGTPNSGGYPLDREYDRSDFFGEPDFNSHDVERKSITALLSHDFGNGLSLQGNLRYSDLTDDFAYVYLYDYAGRTGTVLSRYYYGTDSTADEVIGNAILKYDTTLGPVASSTLGGLEFRDAKTTSASIYGLAGSIDLANPVYTGAPTVSGLYAKSKTDYSAQSLFVTQNFSFDEKLILTFGLRRDFLDLTSTDLLPATPVESKGSFAETSGRAAVTYKATDEISVYASYVESVAPPSIGVEPERGRQYEIGAKYAPMAINALFSASIYDLTKKNVTIAVVQPNGTIERETVGKSRVKGIDLEAKVELSDDLSLIGSYSYMDTEVVQGTLRTGASLAGKEFTTAPKHVASIWANYKLPETVVQGDVTLGLGLRYIGSYYFDTANTSKSEDALLVDASVGVGLGDTASLQLSVSNLFDEQHVVGSGTADYYNPGREIGLTLRKVW
ncbi:MAG TPA: TonB-dependent siderophore receptor [Rhodopila sp.]